MENNKKQSIFFLAFALFFIFSFTANAMELTLDAPTNNKVYTYRTAIPIDIDLTAQETDYPIACSYSINFGITNHTLDCINTAIDIPITNSTDETETKPVHLQYWALNSSNDELMASSDFFIYSNITEGKAIILIGVLVLILVLSYFFMNYALKLGEDFSGLKLLFMILSFITTLVSIHLGNLAIREYLRFEPFNSTYDTVYFATIIFFIIVVLFMIISLFVKAVGSVKIGKGGGMKY